jgi:hypothetical protein
VLLPLKKISKMSVLVLSAFPPDAETENRVAHPILSAARAIALKGRTLSGIPDRLCYREQAANDAFMPLSLTLSPASGGEGNSFLILALLASVGRGIHF